MASVTFDHVTKAYADDAVAVNDLDLLIKDGEFLVLVGPSGCGKTTALRCLAGLEEITAGQIKIDERIVNRVTSKARNIAMVFQSYALYPHMTVFDNLAFGLKLLKTPKQEIRRRVEEAAKILDLERFLDRKPRALSGGQRQRGALGRAIVREPAAGGARAREGGRAASLLDGGAALEPRREAARPDARGDLAHPAAPRHDDRVRHARPGRGADDGRPHRRDEGRHPAAGRPAAGAGRASGEQVRSGFHRRAGHELRESPCRPGEAQAGRAVAEPERPARKARRGAPRQRARDRLPSRGPRDRQRVGRRRCQLPGDGRRG